MLTIHGDEFKNHILGAELRDRIVHDTPFSLYYFGVIFRYYLPWSFFFIAALAVKIGPTLATLTSLSSTKSYFLLLSEKLKVWHGYITQKDNQSFLFSVIWVMWPLILFTLFRIEHSRYMLPVSTPPNAIVYGSGRIPIMKMVIARIWLDILSVFLLTVFVYTLGHLAFDVLSGFPDWAAL
jgi:hypothetical protein